MRQVCKDYIAVISIHAAREGGDAAVQQSDCKLAGFQSTPPVKAATQQPNDIEPRYDGISIHAAREGGDQLGDYAAYKLILFQSTPPVKAATAETYKCNQHSRKQQV